MYNYLAYIQFIATRKTGNIKQAMIACLVKYETVVPVGVLGQDWPAALISNQDHEFLDIMIIIKKNQNEQTYYSLSVNHDKQWNITAQSIYIDDKSTIMVEGYLLTKKGRIFHIVE